MILTKDEIKTKAKLWLRANKDWLKEQKIKEEQKKREREECQSRGTHSGHDPNKPKKTRVRKPKNTAPVSNPHEAIERMLQEKKLSSKINYDVLKNLNKDLVSKFLSIKQSILNLIFLFSRKRTDNLAFPLIRSKKNFTFSVLYRKKIKRSQP
jgi:hypothetical protein